MNEFLSGLEIWQLTLVAIIGVALMLVGYRIKKVSFFLLWFLIGFALAWNVMPWIKQTFTYVEENEIWQYIIPVIAGAILSLLGASIEKFCVGGACFGLIMMVAVQNFGSDMSVLVAGAIIGVIAAGAAVMLMKPVTIIVTSLAGAYLLMSTLPFIFTDVDFHKYNMLIIFGGTALGSLIQFFTTKHVL